MSMESPFLFWNCKYTNGISIKSWRRVEAVTFILTLENLKTAIDGDLMCSSKTQTEASILVTGGGRVFLSLEFSLSLSKM